MCFVFCQSFLLCFSLGAFRKLCKLPSMTNIVTDWLKLTSSWMLHIANFSHCCGIKRAFLRETSLIWGLCLCCRVWSCAVPSSPVAAAVAAAVSAVESANHQRRMRTTSMWTQKTWRPRSKQSRMEEVSLKLVRKGCVSCSDSGNNLLLDSWLVPYCYGLLMSRVVQKTYEFRN